MISIKETNFWMYLARDHREFEIVWAARSWETYPNYGEIAPLWYSTWVEALADYNSHLKGMRVVKNAYPR